MNICIVGGIFPPDVGGPATYLYHLSLSLHKAGHGVRVITLGEDDGGFNFPFKVFRVSRTHPLPVRFMKLIPLILREGRRSHILMVNGLELPVAFVKPLVGRPVIIKIVGDWAWELSRNRGYTELEFEDFQRVSPSLRIGLLKMVRRFYVSRGDVIITPSNYLKKVVCSWGVPPERIRVIHNAVTDRGNIKDRQRAEADLGKKGRIITTVARLVSWKGVDILIEAVAGMEEEVHLLIVGQGPEAGRLKSLAGELGASQRVSFLEDVTHDRVLPLLAASDLFVLNSRYEGFSHVILEAMAAGLPVVASDIEPNREIIEHGVNGLLVPPKDAAAMRSAITDILKDEAMAGKLSANAVKKAKELSWDNLMAKTTKLFTEAASVRPRTV